MLYKLRCVFLLPIIVVYWLSPNKTKLLLREDLSSYSRHFLSSGISLPLNIYSALLYTFVYSRSFRTIFYNRINPFFSSLLRLLWKGETAFSISEDCQIDGGFYAVHAYSTIINAKRIGKNFTCRNCTTIGNKIDGRNNLVPIIGENVVLGSNVVIIGDVNIGNNVTIGAGTVVVKDVPDNCVVVGNPMRILKK